MKFIYFLQKFSRNLFLPCILASINRKGDTYEKEIEENGCLHGGIHRAWNGDSLYLPL